MNPKPSSDSRTKLSDATFTRCMDAVLVFLETNPSIRNSKLREITGIEYDQAITFFNRAILEKTLLRKGHSSGTHYILPNMSKL
jgi:hypothetical protein